jgi:hypothetical protein
LGNGPLLLLPLPLDKKLDGLVPEDFISHCS